MKLFLRTFSSKNFGSRFMGKRSERHAHPSLRVTLASVLFQTLALYLSEGALIRIHVFKKVSATPSSLCLLISGRSHTKPYEGARSLDPLRTWNPQTQQLVSSYPRASSAITSRANSLSEQRSRIARRVGIDVSTQTKTSEASSSAMDWDHLMAGELSG